MGRAGQSPTSLQPGLTDSLSYSTGDSSLGCPALLPSSMVGVPLGCLTDLCNWFPSSGHNFVSTSELIRLPDDCTVGYIVECKLGGHLLPNALFHSHLENLQLISRPQLQEQVNGHPGGA